jgi:alpha-beta hydrolase superfamily lysophospholipase
MRDLTIDTADGLRLTGWLREPASAPRGLIVLVHGMGEHSGRYDHLTANWAAHGFASAGFDVRGHGRSPGPRGHAPSYDARLDDIARVLARAAAEVPDVPVTLYGHSMGGNLVLNYAIRRQPKLAAIVATSPYLRLAFEPPAWRVRMARLLHRVVPALGQPVGLDASALSRDEAVVARYLADPLVHDRITLAFFTHVHAAGDAIVARAAELPAPTLVTHGTDDRFTSRAASEAFVAASAGKAELRLWEGARHEVHNEPEWEALAEYVLAWIARVGGARVAG